MLRRVIRDQKAVTTLWFIWKTNPLINTAIYIQSEFTITFVVRRNFTFVVVLPSIFTFFLRSNFTLAILRSFVVRRNFTYYHVRGAPQRNFWDDRESSTQLASLLSMQFDCKPLLDSHPRLRIFSCASVSRNYINRRRSINGRWDAWRMYEFP